jgi:hypothetical protein
LICHHLDSLRDWSGFPQLYIKSFSHLVPSDLVETIEELNGDFLHAGEQRGGGHWLKTVLVDNTEGPLPSFCSSLFALHVPNNFSRWYDIQQSHPMRHHRMRVPLLWL